jgi:glycosyltransferase involved in cell wall biosynthesis
MDKNWESYIIADLFTDTKDKNVYLSASKDYIKEPMLLQIPYLFSRFIRISNKAQYLKIYIDAMKRYKPGKAKEIIESSDIRIWQYGTYYDLFKYFHEHDILWYQGVTYPYLVASSEHAIRSKNILQAMLDMKPFVIVHSEFIKECLMDLGFKEKSIHIIPLFHRLKIQKHRLSDRKDPKLLTWGRYGTSKQVPQIAKFCFEHNISFTAFGDNSMLSDFKENYKEAKKYENNKIHILPKQKDFLPFVQQHDVFISNSKHEGFLMPAIEAASQGLPLLIRKGTAPDDFFKHKGIKPGFLFKELDEIPGLIEEIARDYDCYSEQANKLARLYTFDIYKKNLLKILETYIKEKKN